MSVEKYLVSLQHVVTEVRILRKEKYLNGSRIYTGSTVAGYYTPDAYETLAADIKRYDVDPGTKGIYTTLHNVNPDMLHRAKNKLVNNVEDTASDDDVLSFSAFPVDIDPPRVSGISSSDAELQDAQSEIVKVFEFYKTLGIPENAIAKAMSGNGWHLLVYLELLENTEQNAERFKAVGDLVAERFGLDTTIYNPGRIWKLYGTTGRKGDNTEERPHRQAKVWLPENLVRMDFADLEQKVTKELALSFTETSPPSETPKPTPETSDPETPSALRAWLDKHKISYTEKPYKGTLKFQLDCPHNPSHKSPDAWVTDEGEFGWQFACSHNTCKNADKNTWAAFKAAVLKKEEVKKAADAADASLLDAIYARYFIGKRFSVPYMVDSVNQNFRVWSGPDDLYVYENERGIYTPENDRIGAFVRDELSHLQTKKLVEETRAHFREKYHFIAEKSESLIPFLNGVLDFETLTLQPHSPENYLTHAYPVNWDVFPEDSAPLDDLMAWLGEIMDKADITTAMEFIGSIFHKGSVHLRKSLLLVGGGRNGKSMLLELIAKLVGRENVGILKWNDYGRDPFAGSKVFGKSVMLDDDIKVEVPISSGIKEVLSGAAINYNEKYKREFAFYPFATWIGASNRVPASKDNTDGFFSRFLIVGFPNQFTVNAAFKKEKEMLWYTPEVLSGFLYLCLSAYKTAWQRGTFSESDQSVGLNEDMRAKTDTIVWFVDKFTQRVPGNLYNRTDLYNVYRSVCSDEGLKAESNQAFYAMVRNMGYVEKKTNGARSFCDIDLTIENPSQETATPEVKF